MFGEGLDSMERVTGYVIRNFGLIWVGVMSIIAFCMIPKASAGTVILPSSQQISQYADGDTGDEYEQPVQRPGQEYADSAFGKGPAPLDANALGRATLDQYQGPGISAGPSRSPAGLVFSAQETGQGGTVGSGSKPSGTPSSSPLTPAMKATVLEGPPPPPAVFSEKISDSAKGKIVTSEGKESRFGKGPNPGLEDLNRMATLRKGVQEVALIAGDLGFFPKTLFVTQDIPVRLFVTGASRTTLCIMMDSFQVRKQVRSQKIEEITFTASVPGRYRYYCPVNGMEGTLIVKEVASNFQQ